MQGGRESGAYADGMESVFFILSVCCTPTLSCRGRRCPVSATPSNAPHCLIPSTTRKNHKETFLLSYFCMTKRRVQGGGATSERRRRDGVYQKSSKDFPSLENLPASSRFALCKQSSPSGANIASEPSHYSLTMATGSKRSSADSDSLLCHVRLRRTSRLIFGCGHGEVCALTGWSYILDVDCMGVYLVGWGLLLPCGDMKLHSPPRQNPQRCCKKCGFMLKFYQKTKIFQNICNHSTENIAYMGEEPSNTVERRQKLWMTAESLICI